MPSPLKSKKMDILPILHYSLPSLLWLAEASGLTGGTRLVEGRQWDNINRQVIILDPHSRPPCTTQVNYLLLVSLVFSVGLVGDTVIQKWMRTQAQTSLPSMTEPPSSYDTGPGSPWW